MRILGALLCLFVATSSCAADEPSSLAKHFVMVHGTSEPPGISKYFPAVAIKSDGNTTILATVSWGGELFRVPPKGRKVDRFHVLDSDQSVHLIACDEKTGVSLFRISGKIESWPTDLVNQDISVGDNLQWLRLENREYKAGMPAATTVQSVNSKLPYTTAAGQDVVVDDTITFSGEASGPPGTFLLTNGKLAAVWLDNEASGPPIPHALSARSFMSGVKQLMAKSLPADSAK